MTAEIWGALGLALLVIAALVAVFVLSRRIKAARVSAAVEGRDLSK